MAVWYDHAYKANDTMVLSAVRGAEGKGESDSIVKCMYNAIGTGRLGVSDGNC